MPATPAPTSIPPPARCCRLRRALAALSVRRSAPSGFHCGSARPAALGRHHGRFVAGPHRCQHDRRVSRGPAHPATTKPHPMPQMMASALEQRVGVVLHPEAVPKLVTLGWNPIRFAIAFRGKTGHQRASFPLQRAEIVIDYRIIPMCCRDGTDGRASTTYKNNHGITGVSKSVERLETGDAVQISSGCRYRRDYGGEFGFCGGHADEGGSDGGGSLRLERHSTSAA